MAAKKRQRTDGTWFVVEHDALSYYGDRNGSSLGEALELLAECNDEGLVLIRGELVEPEIVEIEDHPWFIGVQFHPELKSRPMQPHPLFTAFINAAVTQSRLV